MAKNPSVNQSNDAVRLDKWLWAARFYKTRAIAREMIQGGKVHYNGQRAKPSRSVEIGAIIKLQQGYDEKEVTVAALSERRGNAVVAQSLYQETDESQHKREQLAELRKLNAANGPHPDRRPDKKQRRQIIRFKQQ